MGWAERLNPRSEWNRKRNPIVIREIEIEEEVPRPVEVEKKGWIKRLLKKG